MLSFNFQQNGIKTVRSKGVPFVFRRRYGHGSNFLQAVCHTAAYRPTLSPVLNAVDTYCLNLPANAIYLTRHKCDIRQRIEPTICNPRRRRCFL